MISLPIEITGKVLHGNELGRTLDFPTANIEPDKDLSGLPAGVYYSDTIISGGTYKSITNIGSRPTVTGVPNEGRVTCETYICDYDGDLYGRTITVKLLHFSRAEMRFKDLGELKEQIKLDRAGRLSYDCDTTS